MSSVPLWRNRDFVLLQAGQLLSAAGTESTTMAYPLLVLAVSHSPAQAGLVTFARLAPFALLAGVAADRWRRRRLMIAADVVRTFAVGVLAAVILLGNAAVWEIMLVAFVEGTGSAFFSTAQTGALRAVLPARQLPAAVGAQEARRATVRLGGPPLGGALFGLGRSVPFFVDAVSYLASSLSLLAMRSPFQETRDADRSPLRAQIAEGFRFLWEQPFIRTCAFLYGLGNFLIPGVLLLIVVLGTRQDLSSGEVGALFRKVFSIRTILLMELWAWLATWTFLVWPSVYVLTAAIALVGIAAPVTDSVVVGYRVAMTPDRLLGRVESVRSSISLLIAPLGPLTAGLLLSAVSARATVGLFAAFGLVLALWGTQSPSIRHAPTLDELEAAPSY